MILISWTGLESLLLCCMESWNADMAHFINFLQPSSVPSKQTIYVATRSYVSWFRIPAVGGAFEPSPEDRLLSDALTSVCLVPAPEKLIYHILHSQFYGTCSPAIMNSIYDMKYMGMTSICVTHHSHQELQARGRLAGFPSAAAFSSPDAWVQLALT